MLGTSIWQHVIHRLDRGIAGSTEVQATEMGWVCRSGMKYMSWALELKSSEGKIWLSRKETRGYLKNGMNKHVVAGKLRS